MSTKNIGDECEDALIIAKKRNAEFMFFDRHNPTAQQMLETFWKAGWLDGRITGLREGKNVIEGALSSIAGEKKDSA